MYYLPVEHFVHDLFKQPDVSQHMNNDSVYAAPGSIKASCFIKMTMHGARESPGWGRLTDSWLWRWTVRRNSSSRSRSTLLSGGNEP
jgi:hypothetical protein